MNLIGAVVLLAFGVGALDAGLRAEGGEQFGWMLLAALAFAAALACLAAALVTLGRALRRRWERARRRREARLYTAPGRAKRA